MGNFNKKWGVGAWAVLGLEKKKPGSKRSAFLCGQLPGDRPCMWTSESTQELLRGWEHFLLERLLKAGTPSFCTSGELKR